MIAASTFNDILLAATIMGGFIIMLGMGLGFARWLWKHENHWEDADR